MQNLKEVGKSIWMRFYNWDVCKTNKWLKNNSPTQGY